MRRVVTSVVVYRRSAVLLDSRSTSSSRQSPRRSAVSVGVDLVPLLEAQPDAESSAPEAPSLVIEVPSSSSRVSSASHQMRKFWEPGLAPTFALLVAECRLSTLDAHISAPGLLASTS